MRLRRFRPGGSQSHWLQVLLYFITWGGSFILIFITFSNYCFISLLLVTSLSNSPCSFPSPGSSFFFFQILHLYTCFVDLIVFLMIKRKLSEVFRIQVSQPLQCKITQFSKEVFWCSLSTLNTNIRAWGNSTLATTVLFFSDLEQVTGLGTLFRQFWGHRVMWPITNLYLSIHFQSNWKEKK